MNYYGISINDAATLCGVHRNTIHRWIREKRLKTVRIGQRKQLILPDEMKRFAHENLIDAQVT